MAAVDFSNAHIQPYANNPIKEQNVAIWIPSNANDITDASGTSVCSAVTKTSSTPDEYTLIYTYNGTFNTSGTEFYLTVHDGSAVKYWRIYNISFASGDTFSFSINAKLTL